MPQRNQQELPPLSTQEMEAGLRSSVLPVRRALGLCPEGNQTDSRIPSSVWMSGTLDDLTWSSGFPCSGLSCTPSRPLVSFTGWTLQGWMKSFGLSVLSSMGEPSGLSPSELGSPESPARSLPTSRKFTDLSARTNNLRGAFECLLEASWACATKKLLDAEGHLTGPTENPLRALG